MSAIDKATLENAVNELLDGRPVSDFDSFEAFWEEFDAFFWYEAQDAGEDCSSQRDDIHAIFNELSAASW